MAKVKALLERIEIADEYKWDIDIMYPNEELWDEDYYKVKNLLIKIKEYKGRLNEGPEYLLETLRLSERINRLTENLYVYARMKKDEDNRHSKYQGLYDKALTLSVEVNSTLSFIIPELVSMEKSLIEEFIEKNEELKLYSFFIENVLRQKDHVLSDTEERLLAMFGEISSAPKNIYTILHNADIRFPTVIKDGEKIEITKGNFIKLLEDEDREVRVNAFKGLYSSYKDLINTLGTILSSNVKKDNFYSKVRKYNSALEASLDDDNIPVSVYDNLIDVIHEKIHLLHRYVKLRKKALQLDELHMYDLYVPLVKNPYKEISYEKAKDMVIEGLSPLGEEYVSILKEAFSNRWIDVYENRGKTSGAYSWGSYDSKPYILLNFQNSINDVFTIAHELGHSIHSYLSNKNQPYIYAGYKIFVAEVASTVNENLLIDYLLKNTVDNNKRLFLINHFLEQFRATVYRQTMFAEFEKIIHLKAQEGVAITPDYLCELYYDLNKFYYGDEIVIDDEIKYEWARIPHFYSAFYVYQYATGHSAAVALSQGILKEGPEAINRYINFLKKGGSDYPINLLRGAGVDMATPKPIEESLKVFENLLEEFEKSLNIVN